MQGKCNHLLLCVMVGFALLPAGAALAADPLGVWVTEGGKSHVEIVPCADKLCGSIVWLREPLNDEGVEKTDRNNPDEGLRQRPILGLPLLTGFTANGEADRWDGGKIYNPEDGEIYSCTLTLVDGATLKVRGYVGLPLFGKTQIWTRSR